MRKKERNQLTGCCGTKPFWVKGQQGHEHKKKQETKNAARKTGKQRERNNNKLESMALLAWVCVRVLEDEK